jgi:hypothetical protein
MECAKRDLETLIALIREYSWTRFHKVLTCAPDIEMELQKHTSPIGYSEDTVLLSLMSIDVVVAGDSAPGTWTLVRHDHCEVQYPLDIYGEPDYQRGWVSHQDCTILARNMVDNGRRTEDP